MDRGPEPTGYAQATIACMHSRELASRDGHEPGWVAQTVEGGSEFKRHSASVEMLSSAAEGRGWENWGNRPWGEATGWRDARRRGPSVQMSVEVNNTEKRELQRLPPIYGALSFGWCGRRGSTLGEKHSGLGERQETRAEGTSAQLKGDGPKEGKRQQLHHSGHWKTPIPKRCQREKAGLWARGRVGWVQDVALEAC